MVFFGRCPASPADGNPTTAGARFDSFLGRQPTQSTRVELVLNRQVHSNRVVEATVGRDPCEADGLWTDSNGLALAVVTADCVPILLVHDGGPVAAVHAGWRGVAEQIPAIAVRTLRSVAGKGAVTAVLGPAIRACCYEVGWPVAQRLASVGGAGCVVPAPSSGAGRRPHADLALAARWQLVGSGVEDVRILPFCTRCDPRWHSFRRDGSGGHNLSAVWLQ
jgi:YfiH family protein